jgi:hypothetical protein
MAKAKPLTGLDPHAPTGINARIAARERLKEMNDWERYIDNPANVKELHDLRIAAKRLRYTLEIFEDVLPEACKPIIEELTKIQDELGALHDSDVRTALLRYCLSNQGKAADFTSALSEVEKPQNQEQVKLEPQMVAKLMDLTTAPSDQERQGLEQLLAKEEHLREQQYTTFRQHWHQLQERNFHQQILDALDTKKEKSEPKPQS